MTDTILFLMNGWDSAAGGIQTVNRELAAAIAKERQDLRCIAVVSAASDSEIRDAFARGVQLITGDTANDWASALLAPDLDGIAVDRVAAVIGHSTFSGREAKLLRDRRFPSAKLVQFVHTSPLHLEAMKEDKQASYIAAREQKVAAEIEIAKAADIVVCIGPRLYRSMHDLIIPLARPGLEVRQIDCGVWRAPGPFPERPLRPTVLSLGRTESMGVKGLDILAYAAGHLQRLWMGHPSTRYRPAPQFIIRGTKENAEEFERSLIDLAIQVGSKPTIIARPYTSVRADLDADYRGASIFMMPSREEGFGLVACEALSLGTPTLVSAESGVAELLKQAARENHMEINHCVIPIDGDPKVVGERFAQAALEILSDYDRMQGYFQMMAEHMRAICSWEVGARQLIAHLKIDALPSKTDDPPARQPRPSRQDIATIAERSRASLLEHNGVVSVGVEEVIVVRVRQGLAAPQLPAEIEGVAVVVREGEPIQFTASRDRFSGNLLIGEGRSATATILSILGRTVALTTRHAVDDPKADPITMWMEGRLHRGIVALQGERLDWAILEFPTLSVVAPLLKTREALISEEVFVNFDDTKYDGQISAVEVDVIINGRNGERILYHDLFEVRLDQEAVGGMSGALVVAGSSGGVVGMVVAAATHRGEGADRHSVLYCHPIDDVLAEIAQAMGSAGSRRELARVGILATDQITLSLALEELNQVERSTSGGRHFFVGRDKRRGRDITVCHAPAVGNISAAISMMELIRFAEPDYVLVVGLGGGLDRTMIDVGDVVIASDVIYYEGGSIGGEPVPRVQISGKTTPHLMNAALTVASRATEDKRPFNVMIGTIASGEKIVRDVDAFRAMLRWSQPLAVDMESAGAIEAAATATPNVDVITIRGIADIADGAKRDNVRDVAARNAVQVTFSLIETL